MGPRLEKCTKWRKRGYWRVSVMIQLKVMMGFPSGSVPDTVNFLLWNWMEIALVFDWQTFFYRSVYSKCFLIPIATSFIHFLSSIILTRLKITQVYLPVRRKFWGNPIFSTLSNLKIAAVNWSASFSSYKDTKKFYTVFFWNSHRVSVSVR